MQHESSRAIDTRPIATRAPRRSQIRMRTTLRHRDCRGPVVGTARTSTSIFIVAVLRCFDWDGSGHLVSQSSPFALNCSHFPTGKLKLCTLREVRDLHTLPHTSCTLPHFGKVTHTFPHVRKCDKVTPNLCVKKWAKISSKTLKTFGLKKYNFF